MTSWADDERDPPKAVCPDPYAEPTLEEMDKLVLEQELRSEVRKETERLMRGVEKLKDGCRSLRSQMLGMESRSRGCWGWRCLVKHMCQADRIRVKEIWRNAGMFLRVQGRLSPAELQNMR